MAVGETLARNWDFSVSTNGVSYVTMSGVNNWSLDYGDTMKDSTTFDTNGYGRSVKTVRASTITFEGLYLFDDDTGNRDAGQQMVDASTKQFGSDGVLYYKITHAVDTDSVLIFKGVASHDNRGGKNDDLEMWKVKVAMYGAPVSAAGAWADEF